ncbi:hypothetical protein SOPP22_02850 [Shewanella sp. OPT22]|nr:hypothetical protein SOPP22_02850 [Shewanella sp. OPT22]
MDVGLGSEVQDVPSEPLGIYSILFGTLSFVGAARSVPREGLLENPLLVGFGQKAQGVINFEEI